MEYTKKLQMMAQAHGAAIPAKLDVERQILSRYASSERDCADSKTHGEARARRIERLPGPVPSKRLGLQIMTGDIDRFDFSDYLNLEMNSEIGPRVDTHSAMEAKLSLGANVGRY